MTRRTYDRAPAIPARARAVLQRHGESRAGAGELHRGVGRRAERGLDAYAVDAAHMMGIIEPAADEALAWNERAMVCAEAEARPGGPAVAGDASEQHRLDVLRNRAVHQRASRVRGSSSSAAGAGGRGSRSGSRTTRWPRRGGRWGRSRRRWPSRRCCCASANSTGEPDGYYPRGDWRVPGRAGTGGGGAAALRGRMSCWPRTVDRGKGAGAVGADEGTWEGADAVKDGSMIGKRQAIGFAWAS